MLTLSKANWKSTDAILVEVYSARNSDVVLHKLLFTMKFLTHRAVREQERN